MIAKRIRRALATLFAVEIFSLFLAFTICFFGFYDTASEYYIRPENQLRNFTYFFFSMLVVCIFSTFVLLYFEFKNLIDYANTSILLYFRNLVILLVMTCGISMLVGYSAFGGLAAYICFVFFLLVSLIDLPVSFLVISLLRKLYNDPMNQKNIAIVGINMRSRRFESIIRNNSQLGFNLAGYIDVEPKMLKEKDFLGTPDHIDQILANKRIDLLVIFMPLRSFYDTCQHISNRAEQYGIPVHSMINGFEQENSSDLLLNINDFRHLLLDDDNRIRVTSALKRTFELIAACALLLLLLPVYLACALHIRFYAGSPVFISEPKMGYGKRIIRLYRFRTRQTIQPEQEQDKTENNKADAPTGNDLYTGPYILFGKFIELSRIAFLPRLWNIIFGDISFFGPSAISIQEFEKLSPDLQEKSIASRPGWL